jgi:hypothetical protein
MGDVMPRTNTPSTVPPLEDRLSIEQVAAELRMSISGLRLRIADGRFPKGERLPGAQRVWWRRETVLSYTGQVQTAAG